MLTRYCFTALLCLLLIGLKGQEEENALFAIERNKDDHRIIYYLNTDGNGNLDTQQPIGAYWLREHGDQSRSQSLNALERKYAYGLDFLEVDKERARFRFVSYKKRTFVLTRDQDGKYAVFGEISGKRAKLTSIFLQLDGGTFWFPKIAFIRLQAIDERGNAIVETVHDP